jgi:hypothetical protein
VPYLLDTGVLQWLAKTWRGTPPLSNPHHTDWSGLLHVVRTVINEAREKTSYTTKLVESRLGEAPWLVVHSLTLDSTAFAVLLSLRSSTPSAQKDFGEHESIAMLSDLPDDVVWVSLDQGSESLALDLYGPSRLCSPFDFFIHLGELRLLSFEQVEMAVKLVHKNYRKTPLPLRLQARYDALPR